MKRVVQLISYILVAALASMATMALSRQKPDDSYDKLEQINQIVEQYYIGQADETKMLDAAAAGMIGALEDRWSYYMTAEDYNAYLEQLKNAYVGIGVTIVVREDGYFEVMNVTAGGPAEEAGILPGDILVAVEGEDCAQLGLDETRNRIRGTSGSKVKITVRTADRDRELEIVRRQIETVVAKGEMLDNGIGLITIVNFEKRCAKETIGHIEQLLKQGANALIFDVRFNPGGYKDELVAVLDYLLPEGPLFRSLDYAGKETVDSSDAACLDIPMAVLINDNSYSAAEFFAAAMAEYDAAVTVGTATTGKGRFQTSFRLDDGSAIVLSIGEYCTPNGVSLAGVGLTPDIALDLEEEEYMQLYYGELARENDDQLQAAIQALLN